MPSLPELFYTACLIRRIKVHGKLDVKHLSKPLCHIAVPAEIKIYFKGIGKNHKQCGGCVQEGSLVKTKIDGKSQDISQKYLFSKADGKKHDPSRKIVSLWSAVASVLKLRNHFFIQYNGAGNELGEKGHKSQIISKAVVLRLSQASVNNKGQLLKRKKTDSKRQSNML